MRFKNDEDVYLRCETGGKVYRADLDNVKASGDRFTLEFIEVKRVTLPVKSDYLIGRQELELEYPVNVPDVEKVYQDSDGEYKFLVAGEWLDEDTACDRGYL